MYSDLTALKDRLPEQTVIDLTDDGGLGVVDAGVVDRAITDADTEIDSKIGGRYPVPVAPVPALLQRLSLDLAIEILYARRPDLDTPEAVIRAAKNARLLLSEIAANKASLPGVAEATTATATGGGASFTANERLFTRSRMGGL
ncbi:gp436 family protein [Desulfocastanea catecholica]